MTDFTYRTLNGRTRSDAQGNFTWFHCNQQSTLDYVFTDPNISADMSILTDAAVISDHAVLFT